MVKTLTRHGNSLALVIDKPILELLKIDEKTPLEIRTDGQGLYIGPAAPEQRIEPQRLRESVGKAKQRYGNMLKRLAE